MNTQHNKKVGNEGEDIACAFLENKGYKIIVRNYRFGVSGEIDIVAKDGATWVFVEVKTRKNSDFGSPVEQITKRKAELWRKSVEGYMFNEGIVNEPCRLDFVGVALNNGTPAITHLMNVLC